MLDQNLFMETLRGVAEIVRTSATPLSKEEILGYFSEMELSNEQKEMVFSYLTTAKDQEEEIPVEEDTATTNDETEPEETVKSKSFTMYMEELNNIDNVSDDDMNNMYEALLAGDEDMIAAISNGWLKRISGMAKKHESAKAAIEDLIQEGNLGLFMSLKELCGSNEKIDVEDHLLDAVETSMKAYVSEIMGERDSEETVVGKANLITEAVKFLTEQNGCEPGIKELMEYTRLDEEELTEIMEIIKKAERKK